jgi:hypothetical protein
VTNAHFDFVLLNRLLEQASREKDSKKLLDLTNKIRHVLDGTPEAENHLAQGGEKKSA